MRNHIRRRDFITLLGGAAAAWPIAARAQQAAMPVVGFLLRASAEAGANIAAAFRKGLGETGFAEGRNVAIEYRYADGKADQLLALAADLVRRRVAVIAALGGLATVLSAKGATTTIPIVFETGSDPVEDGLVASFNRPGGNLTGITAMNDVINSKRLGLLHELLPKAARIGLLVDPDSATALNPRSIPIMRAAAAAIGRETGVLFAGTSRAIEEAFASLTARRINALLVTASPVTLGFRVQLANAAVRYGIPTIYPDKSHAEAGGLMSYGVDAMDPFRQAGVYAGRILKGESPADLPVLQPTRFEFVINLQTARLLSIEIPATLLALADKVIE